MNNSYFRRQALGYVQMLEMVRGVVYIGRKLGTFDKSKHFDRISREWFYRREGD